MLGESGGAVHRVDLTGIDDGPLVVTGVDSGEGLEIRCPHCSRTIPWRNTYRGQHLKCPLTDPDCGGDLQVDHFAIGKLPGVRYDVDFELFRWALEDVGLDVITGHASPEVRDRIEEVGQAIDFWSYDRLWELRVPLVDGAERGVLRRGVLAALEVWKHGILRTLRGDGAGPGADLNPLTIDVDPTNPLVDALVEAARPSDSDD